MAKRVQELLVKQLDEAYAMEQTVLRMLDGMIRTTSDPAIVADRETHKEETEQHAQKLRRCLESYGETPSKAKEAVGTLAAFMKAPLDLARGQQAMRNGRDGFATEHLEIATYRLLELLGKRASDEQVIQVARENAADEERMAARIQHNWPRLVDDVLEEEDVRTS